MAPTTRVCVVVPTYNERENIGRLIEEVKVTAIPGLSMLFVDDSSPDGTADVIRTIAAQESWVRLIVRKSKTGIGSAYQDGFRAALEDESCDVILEMDADLQHPPSRIPALLGAINSGSDVAVGSRYVPGGSVSGWGLWRRAVSRGANAYARSLLGIQVNDVTSGFRAYTRAAAEKVSEASLPVKGFEFQVASLSLLAKESKMEEVPYTFSPRAAGKSKLGFRDVVRFFFGVMRLAFV